MRFPDFNLDSEPKDLVRPLGSREDGFSFLVVLPQIILLAALAMMLGEVTRRDARSSNVGLVRLKSSLAVESAINREIFYRLKNERSRPPSTDKSDTTHVIVRVEREVSKVSLNRSPNPTLQRLLSVLCISGSEISSAISWLATRQDSNGPMSDLRRFGGMSQTSYMKLRPHVTRYGFHVRPDLAAASLPVIMATLGVNMARAMELRTANAEQSDIGDTTGIISITAEVSEPNVPRAKTRAVVYLTGKQSDPYRLLELNRDELDPEATETCIADE